ncbi:MAG: 30S ribosomal protein S27e, partial [Thaumarchaeota archaeon]|nr:30S ribosomal protein S27e [Nitrososphaerota archaeon]
MKKDHILVPEPNSKFLKIECKECGEKQVVFSHAST